MLDRIRKLLSGSQTENEVEPGLNPDKVFAELRSKALSISRTELQIPPPPAESAVWGILMECGYPGITLTLLVLDEGTTSVYFSNGAAVIGGGGQDTVHRASEALLATANRCRQHFKPTRSFPGPQAGETVFYARTDSGVQAATASDDDLGSGHHSLSPLFYDGHEVITQVRLIHESMEPGPEAPTA